MWALLFYLCIEGIEPERVWALRKHSGEVFLAKSDEAGTERNALGRRVRCCETARDSPMDHQKRKSTLLSVFFFFSKSKEEIERVQLV